MNHSPDALDGFNKVDMLHYHAFQETLRPLVDRAPASELLSMYRSAREAGDARGRIIAELIEHRVEHAQGLAASADDLSVVKELRRVIDQAQEERIPSAELEGTDIAISSARRAVGLAEALSIRAINPTRNDPTTLSALAAFEAEAEEYAEACRLADEAAAAAAAAEAS